MSYVFVIPSICAALVAYFMLVRAVLNLEDRVRKLEAELPRNWIHPEMQSMFSGGSLGSSPTPPKNI